jgi:uncharacterized lipoprotein YmbA
MMKRSLYVGLVAITALVACSSTPQPVFYTLDNGAASVTQSGKTPSVVLTQTSLPELIDRPQLIVRTGNNQVRISEQHRWAEPLRREIPRVLANDLGQLLGSSRVVALPIDAQGFSADFRVSLDVQRLEASDKNGADIDLLWRIEDRQGKTITGRSTLREASTSEDYGALVAAQRRALSQVAVDIAERIRQP